MLQRQKGFFLDQSSAQEEPLAIPDWKNVKNSALNLLFEKRRKKSGVNSGPKTDDKALAENPKQADPTENEVKLDSV